MRNIKRMLCFGLGILLLFGMNGCGFDQDKRTPTEVVSQSLDTIKSGDSDSILNMLMQNVPAIFRKNSGLKELLPLSSKRMEELLQNISYKINSEKINGDEAVVNVTVTGPDLDDSFDKLISNVSKDIKSGKFGEDDIDIEKICTKYDNELAELLNNVKTSDRTENVKLEKKRGRWVIDDQDDLIKLATNIDPDDYDDKINISSGDIMKLLGM